MIAKDVNCTMLASKQNILYALKQTMAKKIHHHNNTHIPVLYEAVERILAPRSGETYLDLTAGYGGHASMIRSNLGATTGITLVDRDQNAINSLSAFADEGARIIHQDYYGAASDLQRVGEQFDMILLDIGVSSPHLDNAERGFSFQAEAPLDMRMDTRQSLTAQQIVNDYSLQDLMQILKEYGEEPHARSIAQAIVAARPLQTTIQLADVIEAKHSRRGKIHPATRTFQALRIAVNQELTQLQQTLPLIPDLLQPGGRVAIISFHSLEDRIVKRFLKEEAAKGYEARLQILTKKPISGATEDVFNPRARSAKLRAAAKINI